MNRPAISHYVAADRLPPHSIQVERELLGACMLLECNHQAVVDTVRAEDFYRSAHQETFAAIKLLFDRRDAIDSMTVHEELTRAGSDVTIDELMEITSQTAHHVNAPYHAQIVREKAVAREVLRIAGEMASFVHSERFTADELVSHFQAQVAGLSAAGSKMDFADAAEMLDDLYADLAARQEGNQPRAFTGIRELDDLTGGFGGGQLVIVGARTNVGKSILCTQIFEQVTCDQDRHALLFSLEVSKKKLMGKILPSRARASRTRMFNGDSTDDETRRLVHAAPEIRRSNMFADKSFLRGPSAITSAVRQYNAKHPGKLGVVIVDYIQLMVSEANLKNASMKRHEYLAECTRSLKLLAEELNLPIVVAAQVNRDAEKSGDGRPKLHHLRESGSIEMDADIVILIHRPEKDAPGVAMETAEMNVAKARDGECGTVQVRFKKWCTRFVSINEPEDYDPSRPSPF